jgi:hypothetical protein
MATINDLALRYLGEYGNEPVAEEENDLPSLNIPSLEPSGSSSIRRGVGRSPKELRRLLNMDIEEAQSRGKLAANEAQAYEALGTEMEPYFPPQSPYEPLPPPVRGAIDVVSRVGRAAQVASEVPGVVEDIAGTIATAGPAGLAAGTIGLSKVIQDNVNYLLSAGASMPGGKLPPDYYKKLFNRMDEVFQYWVKKPETRAGQEFFQGLGTIFGYIPKQAANAAKKAGATEDEALAVERVTGYVIGLGLPLGLASSPRLIRKIRNFKAKAKSDPGSAGDAAKGVTDDPEFESRYADFLAAKSRLDADRAARTAPSSTEEYFEAFVDTLDRLRRETRGTPEYDAVARELDDLSRNYDIFKGKRAPDEPTPPRSEEPPTPSPTLGPTTPSPTPGPTTPLLPSSGTGGAVLDLPTPPQVPPGGIALDIPPPPAMVPVDIPRPPRTPPGSMGAEAEIPSRENVITSLLSRRIPGEEFPQVRPYSSFMPTPAEARQANTIEAIKARVLDPDNSVDPQGDIERLKLAVRAEGGTISAALRSFGFTPSEIKRTLPRLRETRTINRQRKPPHEPEEPSPSSVVPIAPDTPTGSGGITPVDTAHQTAMNNPLYASASRMIRRDPTTTVDEVASELGISLGEAGQLHGAVMRNLQEANAVIEPPLKKPKKKAGVRPIRHKREIAPPNQLYQETPGLRNLEVALDQNHFSGQLTDPSLGDSPIKVGYQGRKPTGVYVDTTGLGATDSLATIEADLASGSITRDQYMKKMAALSLKARIAGVPINEAHDLIGEDLSANAIKLAQSKGLDVYVKRGNTYEKLPPSVVEIEARDIAPTPDPPETTPEQANEYFDANLAEAESVVESMQAALEAGIDISESLPAKVAPQFKAMLNENRRGISNSERSKFIDILRDLNALLTPDPDTFMGVIGGLSLSPSQQAAARRLYAHILRAGSSVDELIRRSIAAGRLKPIHAPIIKAYFEEIEQPAPPRGMHPGDMTFRGGRGDPIIAVHSREGLIFPPIHLSDGMMVQKAPQLYTSRWTNPVYAFEKYGLLPILHRYRENERFYRRAIRSIEHEVTNLRKEYSENDMRNVVANLYSMTPEGRQLNTHNGVVPRPMTPEQRQLRNIITASLESMFKLVNDVRAVTGKDPMHHVANYFPHIRAFSVRDKLGLSDIKMTGSAADITNAFRTHATTPFPYEKMRRGGFYSADYDGFTIWENYLKSAHRYIAISPITSKVNELIHREMPNVLTGKGSWSMIEKNPQLADFLQTWADGIIGVSPAIWDKFITDPKRQTLARRILRTITHNASASVMAYNIGSALRQFGALNNSYVALGEKYLAVGIAEMLTPGRHTFANETSNILDTRSLADTDIAIMHAFARKDPLEIAVALRDLGFWPHNKIDKLVSEITWLGAYRMATDMKLKGKAARNFADNILVKTQGSTMPGELAAVQRNDLGQAITPLQTFTISQFNFMWHEMFKKATDLKGGIGLLRWMGGLMVMYIIYEKMLNINSPLPSPSPEGGDGVMDYAWELSGLVPFGGGLQHGRTPMPPALQAIFELARVHNPSLRSQTKGAAKLMGLPLSIVESVYNMMDPQSKQGALYPFYRTIEPKGGPRKAGAPASARKPRGR